MMLIHSKCKAILESGEAYPHANDNAKIYRLLFILHLVNQFFEKGLLLILLLLILLLVVYYNNRTRRRQRLGHGHRRKQEQERVVASKKTM
jgi:hypothetical protein